MSRWDRLLLVLPLCWLLLLVAAVGVGSRAAAATRGPGSSALRPPGSPAVRPPGWPGIKPPGGPAARYRQRLPEPAVVDRLVGGLAVLVGRRGEVVVPRSALPPGIEEGVVLDVRLRPWPEEAERRRRELRERRSRLAKDDDGGDIAVGAPW